MKQPMLAAALCAAALFAGCGSSTSSSTTNNSTSGGGGSTLSVGQFKQQFAAQKAQFRQVGKDLAVAIGQADHSTDAQIQAKFASLADRTASSATALRSLKAPAQYQGEVSQLASDFDAVSGDLRKISSSAGSHDAAGAKSATVSLIKHSAALKAVDTRLSSQLGLPSQ